MSDPSEPRPLAALFPVCLVSVVLSACSILYELIAAQTLTMLSANTVVWYSLTVGTFLAAMGVGAWLSGRRPIESSWASLFRVELALTALGALVVPLLHCGHVVFSHLARTPQLMVGVWAMYGIAAIVIAGVGVLTGMELPLLMAAARRVRDETRAANVVLAFDYFGSLIGGVLFPLVLLPRYNLFFIGLATASINLLIALGIQLVHLRRTPGIAWRWAVLGSTACLLGAGMMRTSDVEQYFLKKYYYYLEPAAGWAERFAPMPDMPDIQRFSSPYAKIDFFHDPNPDYSADIMQAFSSKATERPDFPMDRMMFLNGALQLNTRFEEIYHEWFAHVPMMLHGTVPGKVLVLGAGDGLLIRELLKYDDISQIIQVDIDPTLVAFSRTNDVMRAANQDALHDPRVHTIVGDGFQYVRTSDEQFDAVFIDFPDPDNYDLAKLYSREFYHFVLQRIAPGGFGVMDAIGVSFAAPPGPDGRREPFPYNNWPIYYHTLRKAGCGTVLPYVASMELDNPEAAELLRGQGILAEAEAALAVYSEGASELREQLMQTLIRRAMNLHMETLGESFIFFSSEPRDITPRWHDPEVPMHLLNPRRFALSFAVDFPRPAAIDPAKVNSIMLPCFPTTEWWEPRTPF